VDKPNKKLKKIQTKDLTVGMYVHDVGRKWFDHPWTRKSKLVASIEDIQQLIEYGIKEVTIDLTRSASRPKEDDRTKESLKKSQKSKQVENQIQKEPEALPDVVTFEEELPRARETYLTALETTREFLADARAGREINVPKVQDNVEDIIESAFRNRDASLALIKLKTYDEYTLTHSLNVAVLAIGMSCHVNLSRSKIRRLGLGAILHDIGKTKVPLKILNKRSTLTEKEFRAVKSHTVVGAHMLEKTKKIPEEAILVARHHHERIDGSGYPDGISGDQIDDFIAITGMSDVYDALTSDRVYRTSILPHEALKVIFALRDIQFNSLWVERFTQCLGIYPAGTLIKLNSGEIAVVINVNRATLLRPRIKIIFDSRGLPHTGPKTIDLSDKKYLDREVVEVLDPKPLGLDLSIYFQS